MKAKFFHLIMAVWGIVGITIALRNINNSDYASRCWFMGGLLMSILAIVISLIGHGSRRKIVIKATEQIVHFKIFALAKDDAGNYKISYLDGARPQHKILDESTEILVDPEFESSGIAVLEIRKLTEQYTYRLGFIRWPEDTKSSEAYALIIPKPIDVMLELYERR